MPAMTDAGAQAASTRDARRVSALSLPNLLTYGRILATPLVALCLYLDPLWLRWVGLVIFIAAGVSDFFDGYLARRWAQQSAIGRMLDPIADKRLVGATLLMLVANGDIEDLSLWAALIILSREILVSGLREFLAELRVSLPVTRLAKWKTAAQLVAVGFLVAGPAGDRILPVTTTIGLVLLWLSAVVTLYTGYDYFRAGLRHVIEDES
jgi:cardiolipin synthase